MSDRTETPLLHWSLVEAYSSWYCAEGKAGKYSISSVFGMAGVTLAFPNGKSAVAPTYEAAKAIAEDFEAEFIARMRPTTDKFWMVHGIGERAPRYQHYTVESAAKEAQRLAGVYPEIMFVVLEVVDAYRSEKPKINKFDLVVPTHGKTRDDQIPF